MKQPKYFWAWALVVVIVSVVSFIIVTDHVVWEGDAKIIGLDIRYNHVGVKMQTVEGRQFNIEDGSIVMVYFNDNVRIFHCKTFLYGGGTCQ